jgi:hypothetical protein
VRNGGYTGNILFMVFGGGVKKINGSLVTQYSWRYISNTHTQGVKNLWMVELYFPASQQVDRSESKDSNRGNTVHGDLVAFESFRFIYLRSSSGCCGRNWKMSFISRLCRGRVRLSSLRRG